MRSAAGQYGIWRWLGTRQIARSACLPASSEPTASPMPSANAALIVVAMPICADEADCAEALAKFFHEMGGEPTPQAKLAISMSTLPQETTTIVLESRGKA